MENHKIKIKVCEKWILSSRVGLPVGKMLAPYSAYLKAIPFTQTCKSDVDFKILKFPRK